MELFFLFYMLVCESTHWLFLPFVDFFPEEPNQALPIHSILILMVSQLSCCKISISHVKKA